LTRGEVRVVEIPLRPYGMYWKVRIGSYQAYLMSPIANRTIER
jgi:hypothetical protein